MQKFGALFFKAGLSVFFVAGQAVTLSSVSFAQPGARLKKPLLRSLPQAANQCEHLVNFLVSESELGFGASSLDKGVKAKSFRVADLKQSIAVAIDSTEKLPSYISPPPDVEAGLKPLREQERAALDAYTVASDSFKTWERLRSQAATAPSAIPTTVASVERQYQAAKSKLSETMFAHIRKNRALADFIDKHDLLIGADGKAVKPNRARTGIIDQVRLGDVGRAAKFSEQLRMVVDNSSARVPFDEIVVIEKEYDVPALKRAFDNDRASVATMMILARERHDLEALLDAKSGVSRSEVQKAIAAVDAKLKASYSTPEQFEAQNEYRQLQKGNRVVILKNNGEIAGAIKTPSYVTAAGELDELGFRCYSGESAGFWVPDHGFMTAAECQSRSPMEQISCDGSDVSLMSPFVKPGGAPSGPMLIRGAPVTR